MVNAVYAYPWCLSSDDVEARINYLGDLGLTAISLAASYHAGKFIQPGNTRQRVSFPEDGCIYFHPQLSYPRLKPKVAACTQNDDVLDTLSRRGDIQINAWTVLCHNSRLGLEQPHATVRNAFGDSYPYSLCPVNPDVREYGITLCADLVRHYPVAQLLLETPGFLTYSHGYHHEFAQVELNACLEAWLGLCFCEHCIAGASQEGIDAIGLKQQATRRIDGLLTANGTPTADMAQSWLLADLAQQPELVAFLQWRCRQLTQFVADIAAAVGNRASLKIIPTTQRPHATAFWEGTDLCSIARVCDGLELPLYQPSADAMLCDAEDVIHRVGSVDSLSAILRPGWPDMTSESQLLDSVQHLKRLGIRDIAFYHFDMLRPVNFDWLKHALRDAA